MMPNQKVYRVFVSYTGKDLAAHADVVAKVLRALQLLAVDHRDSGATGEPSVTWCMSEVDKADFLVVLVAHRYGWVPTPEEGGDGRRSITQLEVDRARTKGKSILPYIVEEDAPWPGDQFEALVRPEILEDLNRFKSELRRVVAAFFSTPSSLDGPLSRDIPKAMARLEARAQRFGSASNANPTVGPWIYDRNNPPSVEERISGGLPKRILAIQGGGVRAASTIGYLAKFERLLQARYGEADFCLADYFDLIGAVGPSSILAVELARRRSVADAASSFRHALERGFDKPNRLAAFGIGARYSTERLRRSLQDRFGDLPLTDPSFSTAYAVIATSLESAQPVIVSNHPALAAKFHTTRLAEFLLGCFAFPMYFAPASVVDKDGHRHSLIEGETSIGPDPTLALLLLAANPRFPFRWRIGRHRLSIVSMGFENRGSNPSDAGDLSGPGPFVLLKVIARILEALTVGAASQSRMLLEALAVDESVVESGLLEQTAAVTYRHYEPRFQPADLARLGLHELGELHNVPSDAKEFFDRFERVGRAAAAQDVEADQIPVEFDVRVPIRR